MSIITAESHIRNYISDPEKVEKLLSYMDRHETIGEEIFPYLGESDNRLYFNAPSVPKEVFLKRIPFYFYKPEINSLEDIGDLNEYIMGIYSTPRLAKNVAENTDLLYSVIEKMHYHHQLTMKQIFNYPHQQTGMGCQTEFLFKWSHYLDLTESFPGAEKMPKKFIVSYNNILESVGLPPIIYYLQESYTYEYISRKGQVFEVSGTFPCDDDGRPILRWIGLKIKNPMRVWAEVNKRFKGKIFIEAGPKTAIWGLNLWDESEDVEELWTPLHIGPQLMEFDNIELKYIRDREGYTQKEVATAIGTSIRTYQKWESGDTTPDSHNLLRLMNFLDISDTKELTRYMDIKDVSTE
ncbi:helix-turn-helix domain-containing protein [Paenibacillus sp. 79R4]|uniref:helix-turn-helix domain-containing protein n=1 Tax=Paenibacillus sp. 79R4 TaxID=2212847 RepID=UPI0015B922A8|nr:helix-turn-helix transcriptional regulator [Paenibacillus sp. 79R4]